MRLLSVFVTAAVVMLGLVAALVNTAVAQEQPTRQTFETRELTGPEAAPENTTPTEEQSDAQASTPCPGARVVGTVGPTEKGLLIGPFRITGKSFHLTYETTDADPSGLPFFDVTVLDAAGKEVGGQVIFDEGTVSEIVRSGPGNFTIEARAEDLKYKITAEDCTGTGSGGDGRQRVPTDPVPEDQYEADVDPPEDDVIDNTVSDEPLPDTGGIPLLGLTVFAFICVSAGFVLLRPVIRRNN